MTSARFLPCAGGIETHIQEVGTRMVRAGVDLTVLTTDVTGRLPIEEVMNGMHIRRVPAWPKNYDLYFAPGMDRVIRSGAWDLLHCQGCHTLVASQVMLRALRQGIPYVLSFHSGGHSSWLRNRLRPLQWTALRPLIARAQKLICVSEFESQFFQKHLQLPSERFITIPNGARRGSELGVTPSVVDGLIVSVGRLERYKGHQRVIAALPKLRERCPHVRLRIAGDGPYAGQLRRLAERLGVSALVEIRGIPAGQIDEMEALLSQAALVTALSEYESQGISVLEALALGRPVVVAATSALQELADRGLARAVPLETSPDELAAALCEELARKRPRRHLALPDWDDCADRTLDVYGAALSHGTAPQASLSIVGSAR